MQILKAKWIVVNSKNIIKNGAIAFDDKIRAIGDEKGLRAKFKEAKFYDFKDALIAPAFINCHVHLEFSANKTQLLYGDFIAWLGSIVDNGAKVAKKTTSKLIFSAVNSMMKSGVATIGAVSSFGKELEILAASPARVVFFNEILGSNPTAIEQNWQNFMTKFNSSAKFACKRFTPAVSLHSPYSIHPDLAARAIKFARENELLVSTHFLESEHELNWLTGASGGFKNHLLRFTPNPQPHYSPSSYLSMFDGLRTLFTHCVWADFKELKFKFDPSLHSVTHCAVSNRLLGSRSLDISALKEQNLTLNIGTDGLSSNISLNFFDELRAVLMTHAGEELTALSEQIFDAATLGGAKSLGLNLGELKEGKLADIAVYKGFGEIDQAQLLTQLILQTKRAKALYIGGEAVDFNF